MDRIVYFIFGSQTVEVHVDDVPEDATPREIRDMALDIFMMNSHYTIEGRKLIGELANAK